MRHILFVCNHNAGRSQMAQAFFERHAPSDMRADSAGSDPADAVWPEVIEVMKEVGVDLSDRMPKKLDPEMQLQADWAVTMGCGDACPYVPAKVEDWVLDDPKGEPIERVRQIRDKIEDKVKDLITRSDQVRADDTSHRIRLKRILPDLIHEFGGILDDRLIRDCAEDVLTKYADAPVRSYMLAIASKEIRACLKQETSQTMSV